MLFSRLNSETVVPAFVPAGIGTSVMFFAREKGYNGDHGGEHADEEPELFLADAYRFHTFCFLLRPC